MCLFFPRLGLAAALCLILARPAAASFAETGHLAFVALADATAALVIDTAGDHLAGRLDLGLTPNQLVVSPTVPVLAATDGRSARLVLADLASGRLSPIDLPFPARRLLLSPDGTKVGVSDLEGGHAAVLALPDGHAVAGLSGLPPLRDVLFGDDGRTLIVASDRLPGLGIVDLAQGKVTATIPTATGIAGLTRSPNGRQAFLRPVGDGPVTVIDLAGGKPVARIAAGSAVVSATPTGTGDYLLVADEQTKRVTIVHGDDFSLGAVLPADAGMTATYSGWFDSVAFVPSAARHGLLVYDLWRLAKSGDIPLPDDPGPGTVTPDGAKLYLPLAGKQAVAVIDARNRRLAGLIPVEGHPSAVVAAGGYGLCH